MKIVRFEDAAGAIRHGAMQPDGRVTGLVGDLYTDLQPTGETVAVKRILAPLGPTAIYGIGLNYRRHAAESGMAIPERPVLFMKGLNTLQHPDGPIELPTALRSDEVDYECELAVVIGRAAKNVAKENALDHVLGYCCANDVSARDWQLRWGGGQWNRGKCFDTFCPLGPWLVTPDEIPNPNALGIRTRLNGDTVQDWNTNDMIFGVAELIAFLSGSSTLLPGTVILTGTPHGVGMAAKPPRWLRAGDEVEIEIDGLGVLRNPVVNEPAPASTPA